MFNRRKRREIERKKQQEENSFYEKKRKEIYNNIKLTIIENPEKCKIIELIETEDNVVLSCQSKHKILLMKNYFIDIRNNIKYNYNDIFNLNKCSYCITKNRNIIIISKIPFNNENLISEVLFSIEF